MCWGIRELSWYTIDWVELRMTVQLDLSCTDLAPHTLFIIILLLEIATLTRLII